MREGYVNLTVANRDLFNEAFNDLALVFNRQFGPPIPTPPAQTKAQQAKEGLATLNDEEVDCEPVAGHCLGTHFTAGLGVYKLKQLTVA